jgi:hypothetical protein
MSHVYQPIMQRASLQDRIRVAVDAFRDWRTVQVYVADFGYDVTVRACALAQIVPQAP